MIVWIVAGVIVLHVAAFFVFGRMRALPKARYIPPPNFGYREEVYEDPKTGDRTIYREFRVSTKLAEPKGPPATTAPHKSGATK
jgi:hypothetical protein